MSVDGDRLRNLIVKYRDAEKALRAIRRNRGVTLATTEAKQRHNRARDFAETVLLQDGQDQLVGLLGEEAQLAWRLQDVPVGDRPELRARLAEVRRSIRKYISWSYA